jgi:hypothetical protein
MTRPFHGQGGTPLTDHTELLARVDRLITMRHPRPWLNVTSDGQPHVYVRREANAPDHVDLAAALLATITERDAAARRADDMARVIRRLEDCWYATPTPRNWRRSNVPDDGDERPPMTPGEVAALQHARQGDQ